MTDDEIIEMATKFRIGLLDGERPHWRCAEVSWALAGYMRFFKIEAECIDTDLSHLADAMNSGTTPANHVWIRLRDGRALDATADQFNGLLDDLGHLPPVYLGPPLSIHGAAANPPYRAGERGAGGC